MKKLKPLSSYYGTSHYTSFRPGKIYKSYTAFRKVIYLPRMLNRSEISRTFFGGQNFEEIIQKIFEVIIYR